MRAEGDLGIGVAEVDSSQALLEQVGLKVFRSGLRREVVLRQLLEYLRPVGKGRLAPQRVPKPHQFRGRGGATQFLVELVEGRHPTLAVGLLGNLLLQLRIACVELLLILANALSVIEARPIESRIPSRVDHATSRRRLVVSREPPTLRLGNDRHHLAAQVRTGGGIAAHQGGLRARVAHKVRGERLCLR